MGGIQAKTNGIDIEVDSFPDTCPVCRSKIVPQLRYGQKGGRKYSASYSLVFQCPSLRCEELFIAYYGYGGGSRYSWNALRPTEPVAREFSAEIKSVSVLFCDIYQQAQKAEAYGLDQIAGVGYRKSLEFLIKDYAINQHPESENKIKNAPLGSVIENYTKDNLKEVAKRATWLGNDETHYVRKWESKDIADLKRLIELTIQWISMQVLTDNALKAMPE